MIRPGELRERVTIQSASDTTNTLGEVVHTWSDVATVWASVQGLTAREFQAFGQQQTQISHKVRIRWFQGLTQQHRVSWRGRTLEIISMLEQDNRTVHELICQEQF